MKVGWGARCLLQNPAYRMPFTIGNVIERDWAWFDHTKRALGKKQTHRDSPWFTVVDCASLLTNSLTSLFEEVEAPPHNCLSCEDIYILWQTTQVYIGTSDTYVQYLYVYTYIPWIRRSAENEITETCWKNWKKWFKLKMHTERWTLHSFCSLLCPGQLLGWPLELVAVVRTRFCNTWMT